MKKILASLLAVVALLAVMVTPVMAADTTVITGTVQESVEVSAPAGFDFGNMTVGATTATGGNTATVDANHAGWSLTVHEADGDGKMSSNGNILANAMKVMGGDQGTYTDLGGNAAMVTLEDSGAKGTGIEINDIYFSQAVTWGDAVGSYSITLTFTATAATP